MEKFYIYYHFQGYNFDPEWDVANKTVIEAFTQIAAENEFYEKFPNATIWSIDNQD